MAANVEVGFLLAGKACVGQILGGGAAAHGDVYGAAVVAKPVVRVSDRRPQIRGEVGAHDGLANRLAALGQLGEIARIQCVVNEITFAQRVSTK
jgi:hypothetical protein